MENTAANLPSIASFVVALLAALAAGLVGSFALMKRMSLAGDVISHIALPGLGLAFLWHVNPLVGGGTTLFLGTLLIWRLEQRTTLATETAIGVMFAAAVALGTLLTPEEDLIEALFGGFTEPTTTGLFLGLLATLAVIAFILFFKDRLILELFSPELAASTGVNLPRLNLWFLLVFALTVLLGLQFLGALLMGALIIIPAAVGRELTHTLGSFLAVSAAASALSVGAGFLLAARYGLPLGPAIILSATALFLVGLLKRQRFMRRRFLILAALAITLGAAFAALGRPAESVAALPMGAHEFANCTSTGGWAKDPDTAQPIKVQIWENGIRLAEVLANGPRTDGNNGYGFEWAIPDSLKDQEPHRLFAYGMDAASGAQALSGTDKWIQCGKTLPPYTPSAAAAALAQTMKNRGCILSGLIGSELWFPAQDFDRHVAALGRSDCAYVHRAVETWISPPDFQKIGDRIQKIKQATGKDYIFEIMIAEMIKTDAVYYYPDEGRNFNFVDMCKDGVVSNAGGPNTCHPSFYQPEYRKYLRYVTHKAIDSGIRSIMLGEIGSQDGLWWQEPSPPTYSAPAIVKDIRDYAASQGKTVVIVAQAGGSGLVPGESRSIAYAENFDFLLGGMDLVSGIGRFDECIDSESPACKSAYSRPFVYGKPFRALGHGTLVMLDWQNDVNDDPRIFARLNAQGRADFLFNVYTKLKERGAGFIMPFVQGLGGGNLTTECYGPRPSVYSADRTYTHEKACRDEDAIRSVFQGMRWAPPPAETPPPSPTSTTPAPYPEITTFRASPPAIARGDAARLIWAAQYAASCEASRGWGGAKGTSGNEVQRPKQTTTYALFCRNAAGSAIAETTITVTDPPPAPPPTPLPRIITFRADPGMVRRGEPVRLTWESADASRCEAGGGWSGVKTISGSESLTPAAISGYTLTCRNAANASVSAQLKVIVAIPGPATPPPAASSPQIPQPPRRTEIPTTPIGDGVNGGLWNILQNASGSVLEAPQEEEPARLSISGPWIAAIGLGVVLVLGLLISRIGR